MANKINRMTFSVMSVKTKCILDRDLVDGTAKRYDNTVDTSPTDRVDVTNILVNQSPEYGETQEP